MMQPHSRQGSHNITTPAADQSWRYIVTKQHQLSRRALSYCMPRTPSPWCGSTAKAVITAYRSESSIYLGYSFPHHYMNSRCGLNHKKRMGDIPIYSGELQEPSEWISRCSFEKPENVNEF